MILLWLGIAVLLLLAFVFLRMPLKRAAQIADEQQLFEASQQQQNDNVAVYESRLEALDARLAEQDLDQQEYELERAELARRLLADTQALNAKPLQQSRAGRWLVFTLLPCSVLAALSFYHFTGAQDDLALYRVVSQLRHAPPDTQIAVIRKEAERQDDNPKAWSELFVRYRAAGDLTQASDVLNKMIQIEGRKVELLAELAQIRYLAAGRIMTTQVKKLAEEVLARNSSQPTVLGMLGMDAFNKHDYPQAIRHWRQALAGFDDPESAKALEQMIDLASAREKAASQ